MGHYGTEYLGYHAQDAMSCHYVGHYGLPLRRAL